MKRIAAVATAEFLALVRTKFFIIGLLLVPVMLGASIGFENFARRRVDLEDHHFAVIDRTGVLYDGLARAAADHNQTAGSGADRTDAHFLPEPAAPATGAADDELKIDLSRRVRARELFAFVEIPATVLDPDVDPASAASIAYYTETPTYNDLPIWLDKAINHEIARQRLKAASVNPDLIEHLSASAKVSTLGLVERDAAGAVRPAREVRAWQTFILPFGLMYLLMFSVMMSVPHTMTAVVEEKMSRISEVLLASVRPFELLAGKLAGIAAVSVLLSIVYLAGGLYLAVAAGAFGLIQPGLLAWFLLFEICAVLIFGSVFLSVGAACSDLKDAQSMLQPAMFFLIIPVFLSAIILREPNSAISVVASMVPTATPFLMLLRLAMTPPPPAWQVAVSVALTIATAVLFVWAAAKIFRVGLLMQGKPPNLPELMRWIRA